VISGYLEKKPSGTHLAGSHARGPLGIQNTLSSLAALVATVSRMHLSRVLGVGFFAVIATGACHSTRVRPVGALPRIDTLPSQIVDTIGAFRILVQRPADAAMLRLVKIAEGVRVPTDSVLRLAKHNGHPVPADSVANLWWYGAPDGIRIPYGVTGDAVRYYIATSADFRDNRGRGSTGLRMHSTRFEYRATIEQVDSITVGGRRLSGVHVVWLSLSWASWCGDLCGISFRKERVVALSITGDVLAVEGDGPTQWMIL
jgi:hypothetical protein